MKWSNEWTDTKNINNDTQFVFYDVLTADVVNAIVNDVGYLNSKITSEVNTINTTLAGKQNTLTFDSTPTANSNNPVTSGGIKSALNNLTISGKRVLIKTNTIAYSNRFSITETGLYLIEFFLSSEYSNNQFYSDSLLISDLNRDAVKYVIINTGSISSDVYCEILYDSSTKNIELITRGGFAVPEARGSIYKLASINN